MHSSPNPFNPETSIQYGIPEAGRVSITIYDMQGKLVRQLIEENQAAGGYSIIWNGHDEQGNKVYSGVYFYQFNCNQLQQSQKMILMK